MFEAGVDAFYEKAPFRLPSAGHKQVESPAVVPLDSIPLLHRGHIAKSWLPVTGKYFCIGTGHNSLTSSRTPTGLAEIFLELFHSLKSPCSPKLLHGWQAYAVIWGYPCLLRPFQKHFANDSPVILLQPTPVLVFTSWDIQINLMDTSPDYKQENIGSVFK